MNASIFDRIEEAESTLVSISNTAAEFEKEYRAEVAFIPKHFHDLGIIKY